MCATSSSRSIVTVAGRILMMTLTLFSVPPILICISTMHVARIMITWLLAGLPPNYDPNDGDDEELEHWPINHNLFGLIWEHYDDHPDPLFVFINTKPESFHE